MTQTPKTKLIRIALVEAETGNFTKSPDLPGLLVFGKSKAEALAKAPAAIKEMLDYSGGVWIVTVVENPEAIGAEHAFAAIPASAVQEMSDA